MNDLTFTQTSSILNAVVEQATGKSSITPTNTYEFVAVAQTALKVGYDPLVTAISQVLSKTIFSVRPYSRKFKGLYADAVRYGNHVRKLTTVDGELEDDERFKLVDGQSIDMYKVRKPKVLQTNFYGAQVYQKVITIYKDQLDNAFSSAEEFGRFISMIMQNVSDQLEQANENTARATICNLIGAKKVADPDNVIYLLDVYDAETGETSTAESIKQPENFVAFAKWLSAYLKTTADFMSERSYKYHQNFTGYDIPRHTPMNKLKCYMRTSEINDIESSVMTGLFAPEYFKSIDFERVNFWQSIDSPAQIKVKPSYTDANGVEKHDTSVVLDNVLGVIFDEEAAGYTSINEWSAASPLNITGGYHNVAFHKTNRYWVDLSENAVVLLLDHAPTN